MSYYEPVNYRKGLQIMAEHKETVQNEILIHSLISEKKNAPSKESIVTALTPKDKSKSVETTKKGSS